MRLFPPGSSVEDIAVWRATTRRDLLKSKPAPGTLAEDIERYLKMRSAMPSFDDRKREIRMWLSAFGQRQRNSITPQELQSQVNTWMLADPQPSPTTVRHWVDALSNLYRHLNGKSGLNPCKKVRRPAAPPATDRAIDFDLAERIIERMREGSASRIRATILLHTGMRCGELKRITPTNVQLDGSDPTVAVPASKGGYSRRVPLTPAAIAAFTAFAKQELFGVVFSAASLRKRLHLACTKLGTGPIHPHVLRHTFASWLVNEGKVSLKTAQKMLGHRKIETTTRYVREDEKSARAAMTRLGGVGA